MGWQSNLTRDRSAVFSRRRRSVWHSAAVVAVLTSTEAREFVAHGFSLCEGRTDGSVPVVYLCEGGVCRMPITTIEQLEDYLAG